MLYPQSNPHRQMTDLSGFWQIIFDDANTGGHESGFDGGEIIAVPASWNDQFNERRDYTGIAWYQTRFSLPWGWRGQRIFLRFNSVAYLAEVWLNGQRLGMHEGGHLPFAFDITDAVQDADNLIVVRVDGGLAPDRVPPGNLAAMPGTGFGRVDHPDASYDFFPFSGIQRPVLLYTTPNDSIADLTVVTTIEGTTGVVRVKAKVASDTPLNARFSLMGHGADRRVDLVDKGATEAVLPVPNAAFWSPTSPNLYQLRVELLHNGLAVDSYTLDIGIRTIAVDGDRLLLNGEPVNLLGFGRHEDFPVVGKGMLPALIVKDHQIMRWIGANSYRTTHYPYSEQQIQLADRLGFLVIGETPAVGLFFTELGLEKRNALCKHMIAELIDRDKNNPSVIMWSLANEPHTAEPEARAAYYRDFTILDNPSRPLAVQSFKEQAELAHQLDPTRPITLVSHEGATEEAWRFVDVLSLNRYYGWYSESGRTDVGVEKLSRELDLIHERFPGPFILTEFGTDTIPGHHSEPPEMFSEEYQAEFLGKYIAMLFSKPFVVGQHIWNLCDFKTAQGVIRMGAYNFKGVFTRDRRPKLAAHRVRELWANKPK